MRMRSKLATIFPPDGGKSEGIVHRASPISRRRVGGWELLIPVIGESIFLYYYSWGWVADDSPPLGGGWGLKPHLVTILVPIMNQIKRVLYSIALSYYGGKRLDIL